ncbi:MAG: AAA family ATPase [Sphingobacteriales bacterium]|nr:AAA family ATPase [Sphingobacteriales bacterium]
MFFGNNDNNKSSDKDFVKYKFKSLQTYASDEWMANSSKKYRTVFDRSETTYIRCELAFYNKLFDEEDWKCKVTLKAIDITGNRRVVLCSLDKDIDVLKDENIVYVRDGWGNKETAVYWVKGNYVWEAYMDDALVGTQVFFINEVGKVSIQSNPYFAVEYIKLYNGEADGWKQEAANRIYYNKIARQNTRYLWAEIKIVNLTNLDWNYELFLNYFDDAGQHKAVIPRMGRIESGKKDWTYTFDIGWGTDDGGSWKDDRYTLELVFMDILVAAAEFECGEVFQQGDLKMIDGTALPVAVSAAKNENDVSAKYNDKSLEELLQELDKLVGLQPVKKYIHDQITLINFNKLMKEQGVENDTGFSLHSVAVGNPGTGKTTVMRLLGKIYHKLGLLSKGHVLEVDRVDLVGEFIGQTAPRTQKKIDEARGGILFIDEAYSLARSGEDSRDYGKEVIEILIKEMSDGPGDIAIFVAGYPKEMKTFVESNPGLKSRFSQYFTFDDYLPEELSSIGLYIAAKLRLNLDVPAQNMLKEELTEAYRNRDKNFGNARFVEGVINKSKMNMALRLMNTPDQKSLTKEQLTTIRLEDIAKVFEAGKRKQLKLAINTEELDLALAELNQLIGLDNVKLEIDELVRLIKYYNDIDKDVLNKFSLHTVFTGNPGTGKTTVARIMGRVLKALGVLERGHMVEVDRESLVAGYVGQTAIKTNEKVEEALGGVLFIDEAYALAESDSSSNFGKEAIETLLKRMEDLRGQLVVFAAGYTDNMNVFLSSNPGLNSRFDKKLLFQDYTPEQMMQIADWYLKRESLSATEETKSHLLAYFDSLYKNRDKFFGNARTVRQTIDEAVKNQHLRMAKIPAPLRNEKDIYTMLPEDVAEFIYQGNTVKKQLGFRLGGDA